MDVWNVVWFVLMLGLAVVVLVVAVRWLGAGTLNEKQRRTEEKKLREASIVRAGETWDARDLDELMLNMRRYAHWQSIGVAVTFLLTGGIGMVALARAAGGLVNSPVYTFPAMGIWAGSLTLGASIGYITSDRRFVDRAGTLPAPRAEAIFTHVTGVLLRPRWLRWLDVAFTMGVSFCTLLYAAGKGGTLLYLTMSPATARHPWLIWCIPVALYIFLAMRELLAWWEGRRPPLRLTEQPELAGRADLYWRREACKWLSDSPVFRPVPWLSFFQLAAFSSQALSSIETLLLAVALVAALSWNVSPFLRMLWRWTGERRG